MGALIKEQYGLLRLGASTTISQYLIPPLARFHQEIEVSSHFTKWKYSGGLLDKEIETGIVDSRKIKRLNTCRFEDELVLVCRTKLVNKGEITKEEFLQLRFLMQGRIKEH
jgi:DNA-binding transcriptional LysR family regulator